MPRAVDCGIGDLIALAVIFGLARKVTYIGAIAFSILIWGTAEGFGGPYDAASADIGTLRSSTRWISLRC